MNSQGSTIWLIVTLTIAVQPPATLTHHLVVEAAPAPSKWLLSTATDPHHLPLPYLVHLTLALSQQNLFKDQPTSPCLDLHHYWRPQRAVQLASYRPSSNLQTSRYPAPPGETSPSPWSSLNLLRGRLPCQLLRGPLVLP